MKEKTDRRLWGELIKQRRKIKYAKMIEKQKKMEKF